MKKFIGISIMVMQVCMWSDGFGQLKSEWHPLTSLTDSSAYSFQMISPAKNALRVKLPAIDLQYHSLTRSLKFTTLDKELPVLIGRNKAGQKLIIFDHNFNLDFTDDPVELFTDTLTSTSKGNYKHFKGVFQMHGRSVPLTFDYTIVKPRQLNLDLGDSLENKIFFAVRPVQYSHTSIKVEDKRFNLVLFAKNVQDFSKKSAFLMVVTDSVDVRRVKSTDQNYNRYSPGDIMLIGQNKFSFDRLSTFGDSLALTKLNGSSDTIGTQVGFLARNFQGTDILTQAAIQSKNFTGKYILLDFWGTWCAPCIQILNDIKQMHESLDSKKIQMIGICYDNNQLKAADFIKRKGITWTQLFDPRAKSLICNDFEISEFPSFVLIDPSGKIVMREAGLNGFEKVRQSLKSLL